MNEKPGLEPGFFCSTSCWRLTVLPSNTVIARLTSTNRPSEHTEPVG
ncbi:hypothetical protein SAMN05444171_2834 [Bradyrhizobium lablabi]|jgi:hypothetical protein|uniref:Uncharacterized protein n=2 Tax=Bradyrhizobium TaxID=374 RepID=A0ABY0PVK0_9BRAD|nr:hypothetical protein SAMN05444163_4328 [Bradyrhizobium ottawaense]SED00721.1 hypothetical protein SAMN05444171_2834 [Bradyrhizobium lablabi]SHL07812.1 hypothetical protein SAMN05444321_1661 [Bradyrhizobium lablabi]